MQTVARAIARDGHWAQRTTTPVLKVLTAYFDYSSGAHTASTSRVQRWYLESAFGLRPFDVPPLQASCFEAITTVQVYEFLARARVARQYSARTMNHWRRTLMRVFNWAARHMELVYWNGGNPVDGVEAWKERRAGIRYLSSEEIAGQLAALDDNARLQCMVATLIFAGLRRGELTWLTVDDVSLSWGVRGCIHIRAKSLDGGWQPKTGRERVVPISTRLRPYLDVWCDTRPVATHWLFPSPRGKRWDPDNFSAYLRTNNAARGLRWTCLDYRHTFGSHLVQRGESLYKVAELLGNSPDICRRHYAALTGHSLIDAVEF